MLLGMMSLCMSKTHSSAYGAIETLYQSSFCRLNIPFPLKRQPCDQISTLLHLLSLSKDICPSVIQETASRCPPTIHYMKCHSTHMHISPMYIFPSVMLGIEPRGSLMPGKRSTTELPLQSSTYILYLISRLPIMPCLI